MKKLFCTAAALLLGASVSLAAYAKDFGEVTVLGDSITTGYGLDGYQAGNNYSAAGSFGSLIAADCSGYQNLAKDGATSAELLSLLDGEEALGAVSKADSVIISIGGNDFLVPMMSSIQQAILDNSELLNGLAGGNVSVEAVIPQIAGALFAAIQSVDVAKTGENISGIIGKIRAANPDCNIYILTVYDPFEGIEGMEVIEVMAKESLPQLNAGITSAAKNGGAEVVDVYAAFAGHAAEYTNIGKMDIHPSAEGHKVIYSLLSDVMKEGAPSSGNVSNPVADTGVSNPGTDSPKPNPDTGVSDIVFVSAGTLTAVAALVISRRKKD